MSENRSFSGREITAFVVFVVLAAAIAFSSYRTGQNISGGRGASEMAASTAPAPVNGQSLYAANCAACHGAAAAGGIGPALKVTANWTQPQFVGAVLRGQAPGGRTLTPVMPRFGEVGLNGETPTDEQLSALHAYLGSLP